MKVIGNLLLATWLVLTGLMSVVKLHFNYDHMILGALAIVAGVFVALGR